MATLEKALDMMREICLSLPDTREGDHFGETAFYVRGKLFATCGAKHGVCEITFGLEPDHAAALVENDPRFKPYSRDKRGVVLDAAKVKNEFLLYPTGGHGFGLRTQKDARVWPQAALDWLHKIGIQ